jgi:hypothetical protein
MVTVAIRAVELECLVKILDRGQSQSRYMFTDSDSTQNSFWLQLHSPEYDTNVSHASAVSPSLLPQIHIVVCPTKMKITIQYTLSYQVGYLYFSTYILWTEKG